MSDGWLHFYGFAQDPFGPVEHADQLFQADSRSALVASLVQDVVAGAAVVTVRGDSGLGKTSLARQVASQLRARRLLVVEADATTQPMQMHRLIGSITGIPDGDALTPDQLTQALRTHIGALTVVVVQDDADRLPVAGFRMLALLQQLFAFRDLSLRLVLVGALGRWPGLDQPDLEDLRKQCISHVALFPLRDEEAPAYLGHKFGRAGVRLDRVVSKAALVALSREAEGVPARLDALTQRMLDAAYRSRRRRITLRTAWPAVSPDRSWTLPLTLAMLRSPWLAAFGVLLLAGSAGFAFVRQDDLVASLDLQAAADTLSAAFSGGEPEPALPPLASLLRSPAPEAALAWAQEPAQATEFRDGAMVAEAPEGAQPDDEPKVADAAPAEGALAAAEPSVVLPPAPVLPAPPPSRQEEAIQPNPQEAAPPRQVATPARAAIMDALGVPTPGLEPAGATGRSPHGGPGLMLVAGEADTLPTLYARVYRGVTPPPYSDLVAANQAPVKPGMLLIFPAPPHGWGIR